MKSKDMNIAFYMTTTLNYGGGFEKFFIETAVELNKMPGVKVTIITRDEKYTKSLQRLLGMYYLQGKKMIIKNEVTSDIRQRLQGVLYIKCASFAKVKECLKKFSIVYSKGELLEAFIFKMLMKYDELPPVVMVFGTPLLYSDKARSFYARLHNFLYQSRLFCSLTSGVRGFHVKNLADFRLLRTLAPKKPTIQLFNPFDTVSFDNQARENFFKSTIDSKKINIAWVGRLTEQKGVDEFISVVQRVNSTKYGDSICWNIAGDGEQREKIEALCKAADNVAHFLHIPHKYMPSFYLQNDIYISTSKWEGSPNAIAEAIASGLLISVLKNQGTDSFLNHIGMSEVQVESSDDLIKKLLQYIPLAKGRGESNKEKINKLSPSQFYSELENFLNLCAESKK